jgi:hypothetical protein
MDWNQEFIITAALYFRLVEFALQYDSADSLEILAF